MSRLNPPPQAQNADVEVDAIWQVLDICGIQGLRVSVHRSKIEVRSGEQFFWLSRKTVEAFWRKADHDRSLAENNTAPTGPKCG